MKTLSPLMAFAQQSVLDTGGPNAGTIGKLLNFFFVLLALIFLVVIVMAFLPLLRRHRGIDQEPLEKTHTPSAATEHKLGRIVGVASGVSVLILIGLVIASVSVGKSVAGARPGTDSLTIEIT